MMSDFGMMQPNNDIPKMTQPDVQFYNQGFPNPNMYMRAEPLNMNFMQPNFDMTGQT